MSSSHTNDNPQKDTTHLHQPPRNVRILVASTSTTPPSTALLDLLVRRLIEHDVHLSAICDASQCVTASVLVRSIATPNIDFSSPLDYPSRSHALYLTKDVEAARQSAAELAQWAELLILAPMDANNIARMLHGMADSLLQELLRTWDVSKKILLVPGMSSAAWENPMTKKQLNKIRKRWNWVRLLPPVLWNCTVRGGAKENEQSSESDESSVGEWHGMDVLMGAVKNQLELATIGKDLDVGRMSYPDALHDQPAASSKPPRPLPPELWSIVLEYTQDWELAHALGVHTNLPTPPEWLPVVNGKTPLSFDRQLEATLLHGNPSEVCALFQSNPNPPPYLSRLSIKLIMRFGLVPVLQYLETNHKDLFWTAFGHAFLPDKASSVFGRVELLEYWRTSPTFLTEEYTSAAVDGASAIGFVHVLDWWRSSGLPLKYTDASLEQASWHGHIAVLDWWRSASKYSRVDANCHIRSSASPITTTVATPPPPPLDLKVGKSICHATQSGSLATLSWWSTSTIPFSHEDAVAKLASAHGHVHLLSFWLAHRGPSKMLFDAQVLVAPTKLGHVRVLEWWRKSGLRVEYKTCDIEEALEDGDSEAVRRWWARNGLNLGVGTSEWMRTKVL